MNQFLSFSLQLRLTFFSYSIINFLLKGPIPFLLLLYFFDGLDFQRAIKILSKPSHGLVDFNHFDGGPIHFCFKFSFLHFGLNDIHRDNSFGSRRIVEFSDNGFHSFYPNDAQIVHLLIDILLLQPLIAGGDDVQPQQSLSQQTANFLLLLVANSNIFEDRDDHFRAHFDCNNKEQFKIKLVDKSGLFDLLLIELLYIFVQFLDGGVFLRRFK